MKYNNSIRKQIQTSILVDSTIKWSDMPDPGIIKEN